MTAAQRKVTAFRLDDDLLDGLQAVYERDGILPSEQVRRAVRAWLQTKDVMAKKKDGASAANVKKKADARKSE